MGITGQMGKESRVSLEDLVVQEPEGERKQKAVEFFVEDEIDEEGWDGISEKYKGWVEDSRFVSSHPIAAAIFVAPDRVPDLDLSNKCTEIIASIDEFLEKEQTHEGQQYDALRALQRSYELKIIAPEKVTELNLADKWERSYKAYHYHRSNGYWPQAIKAAFHLYALYPDRKSELELDRFWVHFRDSYEHCIELEEKRDGINLAVCLKVLYPEKVAELKLEDRWPEIKSVFDDDRDDKDWPRVIMQAMLLKILAAKKVNISEGGIKVIMPTKEGYRSEIPPRPKRKETN